MKRDRAVIKDETGETLKVITIKKGRSKFNWNEKSYNVYRNEAYSDKIKGVFFTDKRYFYVANNPNPLLVTKDKTELKPIIDTEVYNAILENEVLKALNKPSLSWLKNIKPIHIVIALSVLAVVGYYLGNPT